MSALNRFLLLGLLFLSWPLSGDASLLSGAARETSETDWPQVVETEPATPWDRAVAWTLAQQRALHRQLAEGLQDLRETPSLWSAAALVLVSFLYGIFHAVGPGHGKAVITTYLLTQRVPVRRGVALSFAAALLQGLSAILIVSVVLFLAGRATREALSQASLLEQFSFTLVILLGAWLTFRALRAIAASRGQPGQPMPGRRSDPSVCERAGAGGPERKASSSDIASAKWNAANAGAVPVVGVIAAVGVRPCTGAILVLVVAQLMGLWIAGLVAVMAMSVGTAITVATLAVLAVQTRQLAMWATGASRPGWQRAGQVVALAGGLAIMAVGSLLLVGSLNAPVTHPLGIRF
ncbi:nickel/cobalt transporter [Thioalkalicoccus limnaeus]|uniref:Nickel/cobalt efflux system n=1 Tax=Thioalkalicoccus limnaeus TaxID=120681 RepID=A0ABV4BCA5_9GAMM